MCKIAKELELFMVLLSKIGEDPFLICGNPLTEFSNIANEYGSITLKWVTGIICITVFLISAQLVVIYDASVGSGGDQHQ